MSPGRSTRYRPVGGGGGGGGPNVVYDEPLAMEDTPALGFELPDPLAMDDVIAMGSVQVDAVNMGDDYGIVSQATYSEPLAMDDLQAMGFLLPEALAMDDVLSMGFALPETARMDDVLAMGSELPERLVMDDVLAIGSELPDTARFADVIAMGFALPEPLAMDDVISMGSLQFDDFDLQDAGKLPVTGWVVGRSGTPNTDPMSDGWADQADTATNHGNESLLAKGSVTALNNERQAFLQLDLTRLAGGIDDDIGGAVLWFIASTSNAILATTLTCGYAVQASQWFTESTMTWATGRPTPTFTSLGTLSVPPGAAQLQNLNIPQADLSLMIGKWVVFRFTTAGGAVVDTVTILSRDNATASNRPYFDGDFKIV